jgi:hypothetical protein
MKAIIFVIILFPSYCYSQGNNDSIWRKDLVGIWQEGTPIVPNGYQQIYIFFPDGSYELVTNSWYATSNNFGFKGHYKIKRGTQTLFLLIDSTREGKNCKYKYDDEPGIAADWISVCDSIITKKYTSSDNEFEIPIEWTSPEKEFNYWDKPLQCILMDGKFRYYKVSDKTDPQ